MAKPKRWRNNRDGSSYLALPHIVIESPSYRELGYAARALLIDIASQYNGKNNGKLVACAKFLRPLGWNSNDTIYRALAKLKESGLIVETRLGAQPNRAAWFALAWYDLDVRDGLDIDPAKYRCQATSRTDPLTTFRIDPLG